MEGSGLEQFFQSLSPQAKAEILRQMKKRRRKKLLVGILRILVGVVMMLGGAFLMFYFADKVFSSLHEYYKKGPMYLAAGCIGVGAAIFQWYRRRQK